MSAVNMLQIRLIRAALIEGRMDVQQILDLLRYRRLGAVDDATVAREIKNLTIALGYARALRANLAFLQAEGAPRAQSGLSTRYLVDAYAHTLVMLGQARLRIASSLRILLASSEN